MIRQFELVERVKAYDPNADEAGINAAYVFAMKMHGSQTRASGDPYFSHPIEVAGILTDYKVDTATIETALLHDTIEDTPASLEDIRNHFGEDVAQLVDGVTKLTRIEFQSDRDKQAENFRKLVLAMSEDIRVLLVKLADRLHNMRTLHFIESEEKRRRIALETMEIYAPLAERIGMQEIKTELEDLAFEQLNPEARKAVVTRLETLRQHGGELVPKIIEQVSDVLTKANIQAQVNGREKTPYSIWRKMQKHDVGFEQLSDIMAFRVIVGSKEDSYRALGVIHGAYRVVPGRFKDYISVPKPNGYQSIHTGVFGPLNHRIELQIRTLEMHEIAEFGVAAHWNYKQGGVASDGKQYRWLRELLDILEHAADPEEVLEHSKMEMFQDQVFCFTPRGDLISLPRGATTVDFAYAVHSEVGDHCVGAKINGKMMPLRTELRNGDQVDIVTSKAQTPNPTWERFVVTGKARARIRQFVRLTEREEYAKLGQSMLQRTFKENDYDLTDKGLSAALKKLDQDTVKDLCVSVGNGTLIARAVLEAVYPRARRKNNTADDGTVVALASARNASKSKTGSDDDGLPIHGLIPGMAMHFADCCNALPGDRIVGIVVPGRGITVHTIDCATLAEFGDEPDRWLDLSWDVDEASRDLHVGRVFVTVANSPGSLGDLSTMIAKNDGNISNLKIVNRSTDFFDMLIDVEVRDVKHLTEIIAALRATPTVNSVDRAKG